MKAERNRAKTDVSAARTTQRKAEQTAKSFGGCRLTVDCCLLPDVSWKSSTVVCYLLSVVVCCLLSIALLLAVS